MTTLKIGEKEYQLKLTTRGMIMLEKELKANPVEMLIDMSNGKMPKTEDILTILKHCLSISTEEVYDIYDKYVEQGNNWIDLVMIFTEVFTECGYIKKLDKKDEVKNV